MSNMFRDVAVALFAVGLAIFGMFMINSTAKSQPAEECVVASVVMEKARNNAMTVTSYDNVATLAILATLTNAFGPPPIDYTPTNIITATKDDMSVVNIGFVENGCLRSVFTVAKDTWADILKRTFRGA